MNGYVHFDLAPPRSWDHFEELCADTFQEEWQDATLVRHGRAGQAQHGVDIVGRIGAVWPVGLQCKKKTRWPVKEVRTSELDEEVEKAKNFNPPLQAFYLISTAPDDQPLQEHARIITDRHKQQGLFSVSVLGWGELVRRATRHNNVAAKHFGPFSTGPATPLLATWRAANAKLLMNDDELAISIKELIHDLIDYPAGRIILRQQETEDLLFQITNRQAAETDTLADRIAVVDLRDKLKILRDRERAVAAGLQLLLGHKDMRDYVRIVWEKDAPLLIRSFVEQELDPDGSNVTGLENTHPSSGNPARRLDCGFHARIRNRSYFPASNGFEEEISNHQRRYYQRTSFERSIRIRNTSGTSSSDMEFIRRNFFEEHGRKGVARHELVESYNLKL